MSVNVFDKEKDSLIPTAGYTSKEEINELKEDLGGLKFGIDGDGNRGYYGDDGILVPFKKGILSSRINMIQKEQNSPSTIVYDVKDMKKVTIKCRCNYDYHASINLYYLLDSAKTELAYTKTDTVTEVDLTNVQELSIQTNNSITISNARTFHVELDFE